MTFIFEIYMFLSNNPSSGGGGGYKFVEFVLFFSTNFLLFVSFLLILINMQKQKFVYQHGRKKN